MIADYHVHTPYCGHAHGSIIQYVESAIACGIDEIGFADHLGRYYLTRTQKKRYWDWGMGERDLARYFSELLDLRDTFEDRIAIKIGLEVDYVEGAEEIVEPILKQYPFDFTLCSIHCIPKFGWEHIANYSQANSEEVYHYYFIAAQSALKCRIFSSLAHLDFIWRYIKWPEISPELVFKDLSETVRLAATLNTNLEINANGYLWSQANSINGDDPFELLIDQIRQYHVPITIGSDAHEPSMVGKAFPDLIELLHHKGIRTFTKFTCGIPSVVPLG